MISVIVPVFNTGQMLSACIGSIRAQSFTDWELILVDDGSTDGSGELCDGYAASDARIRVVHRPNGGASAARNEGIAMAEGAEIAFIDSDDQVHPAYLETLHRLRKTYRADVSTVSFTDCFGKRCRRICRERVFSFRQAMQQMLYQRGCIDSSPCKLFDAGLVKACLFDERYRVYEDLEWLSRLYGKNGRIVHSELPLYQYEKRLSGTLSSRSPVLDDAFGVTMSIERSMEARQDRLLCRAARSRRLSVCFNILRLLAVSKTSLEEVASSVMANRCWSEIRSLRGRCFADVRLRMKNRAGILLSLMGFHVVLKVFRILSSGQ